jgi:predicted small metal-binding protein
MGETLDRQLREIRRREQTLSNLLGPADYTSQLQTMLAGYTAAQKAALGAQRLVEESTRWQGLIDQLDHQRRFDELRRSTLMSSWCTWQASTESLSELFRSHPGAGRQDIERLLRPIEEYSRYARGAVRQLVESTDEVEQAAVAGGLALAEEQVEESTALVADALADGQFTVLPDHSGSSAATDALQSEASVIELPAHALVFYVQQRQLAVHGIDIVQATGPSLLLLSSAARLSQRIRSLGNLVLECNRAAKWAAQEEVFKPTTTWAESLHTMSYIAVSDRDSLGAFVDCLFHLLYEAAGDDNLRFLQYVDSGTECTAIWAVKHLRNKTMRHDPDHGKVKKIKKSWAELNASLQTIGISSWPVSADDFAATQERLVEAVHEFLSLLLRRIQDAGRVPSQVPDELTVQH